MSNTEPHECARCGTLRPKSQMSNIGGVWACNQSAGVSCAMQLAYRGYGDE